jgi:AcrR family transcriptional regulator
VSRPRGRRPGGSRAREQILVAARRQFAEHGFRATSLRRVAADAGVDVRLVSHYFGSKADLFVAAVELPFDPEPTFDALLAGGRVGLGARLAAFVVGVLDYPAGRDTITGLIRAAASEEQAATLMRQRLVEQILLPLARRIGTDHAELRASFMGSQIGGLVLARHVIGLPELAAADPDVLVAMLAPVLARCLTEPVTGLAEPVTDLAEPVTDLAEPVTDLAEPVTDLAEPVTRDPAPPDPSARAS